MSPELLKVTTRRIGKVLTLFLTSCCDREHCLKAFTSPPAAFYISIISDTKLSAHCSQLQGAAPPAPLSSATITKPFSGVRCFHGFRKQSPSRLELFTFSFQSQRGYRADKITLLIAELRPVIFFPCSYFKCYRAPLIVIFVRMIWVGNSHGTGV